LNGPYYVGDLDRIVAAGAVGVYILSRDGRTAHYVGRSDADLRTRIWQSAQADGYLYFWFGYETSPMNAYRAECVLWHRYQPPDNLNHPAVPPGTNWRCPVSGCPWS
jgi:hypothetical protein